MKKKLLILSVIALLSVAVLGTLAYLNAEETTTNVITTGSVDMVLYELDKDGNRYNEGMSFDDVMPGMVLYKEPIIENLDDTQAFYTRARVTVTATAKNGASLSADPIALNIGEDWVYSDGWYYYCGEVAPDDKVTLFTNVTIDSAMGNEYQHCDVSVKIEAQAVQVKNNEVNANYGGDYTKIQGWPAVLAQL